MISPSCEHISSASLGFIFLPFTMQGWCAGRELPALLPRAGTGKDPHVSWRICTGVKLVQCNDAAKPASLASPHQVGADWSHMEMLRLQHFNGKNHYGTHLPENGTNLLTGIFVFCFS